MNVPDYATMTDDQVGHVYDDAIQRLIRSAHKVTRRQMVEFLQSDLSRFSRTKWEELELFRADNPLIDSLETLMMNVALWLNEVADGWNVFRVGHFDTGAEVRLSSRGGDPTIEWETNTGWQPDFKADIEETVNACILAHEDLYPWFFADFEGDKENLFPIFFAINGSAVTISLRAYGLSDMEKAYYCGMIDMYNDITDELESS